MHHMSLSTNTATASMAQAQLDLANSGLLKSQNLFVIQLSKTLKLKIHKKKSGCVITIFYKKRKSFCIPYSEFVLLFTCSEVLQLASELLSGTVFQET